MRRDVNTAFRLIVLIPAALLMAGVAIVGLGFGGLSFGSVALAVLIAGAPIALIAWTLSDHRRRGRALSK